MVHGFPEEVHVIENQVQEPRLGMALDFIRQGLDSSEPGLDSLVEAGCTARTVPEGPVDLRRLVELGLTKVTDFHRAFAQGETLAIDVDGHWQAVVACQYS